MLFNFRGVNFGLSLLILIEGVGGSSSANIIKQGGSTYANRLLTRGEGGSKNLSFMLTLYVHLPLYRAPMIKNKW